jgi:hypothetical protein
LCIEIEEIASMRQGNMQVVQFSFGDTANQLKATKSQGFDLCSRLFKSLRATFLNIISLVKLQGKIEAGRSRGLWSLVSDGVVSLIFLSEIGRVHFNVASHRNFVLSSRPTDMTTKEKT